MPSYTNITVNSAKYIADGSIEFDVDVSIDGVAMTGLGHSYKENPFNAIDIVCKKWLESNTPTAFSAYVPSNTEVALGVRAERDRRLLLSDWTALPDAPFSDTVKQQWKTYRQTLRDVPAQTGFPGSVTWPTEPGAPAEEE